MFTRVLKTTALLITIAAFLLPSVSQAAIIDILTTGIYYANPVTGGVVGGFVGGVALGKATYKWVNSIGEAQEVTFDRRAFGQGPAGRAANAAIDAASDTSKHANDIIGVYNRAERGDYTLTADQKIALEREINSAKVATNLATEAAAKSAAAATELARSRNAGELPLTDSERAQLTAEAQSQSQIALQQRDVALANVQNAQEISGRNPQAEGAVEATNNAANGDVDQCSLAPAVGGVLGGVAGAAVGGAVSDGSVYGCIRLFFAVAANISLNLQALLLWIAGQLLDLSINYTIVNLKSNLDQLNVIDAAWQTFRDVGNMVFIFVLLYVGIRRILGLSAGREVISRVIIIALFVNFSLFTTRIVIDATNVLAIGIYNKAVESVPVATDNQNDPKPSGEKSISYAFMDSLNLQTFVTQSRNNNDPFANFKGVPEIRKIVLVGVVGSIFLLTVSLTFFFVAVIFLYRYVSFILLMILSPLAFISWAIPGYSSQMSKWWNQLVKNAVFAPVWMLFMFAVLQIIGGLKQSLVALNKVDANASFGAIFAGDGDSISLVMNFIIIIILLGGSTLIANNLSVSGAGAASKLTKRVGGYVRSGYTSAGRVVGAAGIQLPSAIARRTIGAGAASLAASKGLQKAANGGGLRGFFARRAQEAANITTGSSFNVLNTGFGNTAVGKILGKGTGKGGYTQYVKDLKKKAENDVKRFDLSDTDKAVLEGNIKAAEKTRDDVATKVNEQTAAVFADPTLVADLARATKKAKDVADLRDPEIDILTAELAAATQEERTLRNSGNIAGASAAANRVRRITAELETKRTDIETAAAEKTRLAKKLAVEQDRVADARKGIRDSFKAELAATLPALDAARIEKDKALGLSEEDFKKRIVGREIMVNGNPVTVEKDLKELNKFIKENPDEYRQITKAFADIGIKEQRGYVKENKETYVKEVVAPERGILAAAYTVGDFFGTGVFGTQNAKGARYAAAGAILSKLNEKTNKDNVFDTLQRIVKEEAEASAPIPTPGTTT